MVANYNVLRVAEGGARFPANLTDADSLLYFTQLLR